MYLAVSDKGDRIFVSLTCSCHNMSRPGDALCGFGVILQHQRTSSLCLCLALPSSLSRSPSPSLPPGLREPGLHSSPCHSRAGSRRRENTAAPRPEWNVPKFWNLKPWRGYLPEGSLEPVSTQKTLERRFYRGEDAGF